MLLKAKKQHIMFILSRVDDKNVFIYINKKEYEIKCHRMFKGMSI